MVTLAAVPNDEEPETVADTPPQVLVRTFLTPSGMPWDQVRGAQLEARHGAPLPIADLQYRVKRLEPWGLRRPARFAVFYVRRADVRGPFETTVNVDGETTRVAFGGAKEAAQGLPELALQVLALAVSIAITIALAAGVWTARQDAEQRLEGLERQAAAKLRAAQRLQHDQLQDNALAASRDKAAQVVDVLSDLEWVARARSPEARLLSVHWDRGLMAVETRRGEPPLEAHDRQIVRSSKISRAGTWLWGVSRPPSHEVGR